MDHVLCCKQNNGEIEARHDAIVREFKNLTNHAGLQFIDARLGESSTVNQVDDRAADGCIRGLCHKPLHIDVTVANPTGQTCLNISQNEDNSSSIRQHANREKERIKNDKHLHRCQEINAKFMPLAFEIHGSASDSVNKLIRSLVSKAAEITFAPYHILLSYWRKRFSVCLQHHNALIINQAYLRLNNHGGGNMNRDFDIENIS